MDESLLKNIASQLAVRIVRNNGYLARQEISLLIEKIKIDCLRLEPFGFKVYSQADEDGIIEEIMRRLKIQTGTFCEIGVESGLECNSFYLLHKGWTGLWIEGNSKQRNFILEKFGSLIPNRMKLVIEMVTRENINNILDASNCLPLDFDFLSIDVDGNDIYLLEALTFKPKVICVEYNSKFPSTLSKRQTYEPHKYWQGTDYMGASLKSVTDVARYKGYQLVGTNLVGSNAFFVRNDLVGDLFCQNCSPENLYNPPRYWLIYDHYQQIGHRADFGPYVDLL